MTATNEPQPATDSPIMANIRRLLQRIEDSKPNVICSPQDEAVIAAELERQGVAHLVNLHASEFCKQGEMFVSRPVRLTDLGVGFG